jgi:hypothetical protein
MKVSPPGMTPCERFVILKVVDLIRWETDHDGDWLDCPAIPAERVRSFDLRGKQIELTMRSAR